MPDLAQLPTEQLLLVNEVRQLIDSAKQRAAVAVNAEISVLYWQVGQRIYQEFLQGERAEYGKQLIAGLSQQLKQTYGKGWSEQQLRHCLYAAETFSDEKIFYTLCRELSWSHLRHIMYMEDSLKCEFYVEMCRLERFIVPTVSVGIHLRTLCVP